MQNVHVVKDIKLQQLLKKGLNYRDQQPPDKTKAHNSIQVGIETYGSSNSKKTNIPSNQFSEWCSKVLTLVKEKLDTMNFYKFCSILRNGDVKKSLAELHEDFVIAPIDKASNNVSIVCKQFYIDTLKGEIENSDTFEPSLKTQQSIFNEHKSYYDKVKNLENPPKQRFITCGTFQQVWKKLYI